MTCEYISELLPLYLDDDALTKEQLRLVEQHLASCTSCSALLADLKRDQQSLVSLPDVPTPPDFSLQLMQKLEAKQQKPPAWRYFVPRLGSLAAALVMMLLVSNLYVFPQMQLARVDDAEANPILMMQNEPEEDKTDEQVMGIMSTQKAFTDLEGTQPEANSWQRQYWVWSSSLAVGLFGLGSGLIYRRYRIQD